MSKPCYVYFIGLRNGGSVLPYCKIGLSDNVNSRLGQLNASNPFDCYIYKTVKCSSRANAAAVEAILLGKASRHRRKGEWFNGAPGTIYGLLEGEIKALKSTATDDPVATYTSPRRKLTPREVRDVFTKPKPGGLGESLRLHMERHASGG